MSSGWNTIESDAGVFTELVESFGAKSVEFAEVFTLDPDELRNIQPIYGVIFLFKWTPELARSPDSDENGVFDRESSNLFFAHQKIQNACATQAILSILLNRADIHIGETLNDFKEFVADFGAELRGETLSNSDLIRHVHNSFSRPTPFINEAAMNQDSTTGEDVYHFIAYTVTNGKLYELDGLQPYPISHGYCDDAVFPERITDVLTRRIARYPATEIRFNLLAVVHNQLELLEAAGDMAGVLQEKEKRATWKRESVLRKHNYVGMINVLLKGMVADTLQKEGESGLEKRLDDGMRKSMKRLGQM
ncbi:ubiquitin carboxyl-terminal hydrolase [Dipodascopsis tothii]|uniref:ubiquitin carboxyl-terminal hydrolase n=1 Tax=Dipodascopsis tothii TaxID=44089 RepID=UPI0034CDF79A